MQISIGARLLLKFKLFREFPLRWFFWWVVVPNLSVILMWPIGGPAMGTTIFFTGLLALGVSQIPSRLVRVFGVVAIYATLVSSYLMNSFNLGLSKFFSTFKFASEIDISSSPEYAAAAAVILVSVVLTALFSPSGKVISGWRLKLLAVFGISMLMHVDTYVTAGTRGSYKGSAPPGTPMDSAILQTGITVDKINASNLIVVVVESWGVSTEAEDVALFNEIWRPERWSPRYQLTKGETLYFGSTTNAEIRELCGVWADHEEFTFEGSNCLPRQLKEAGFKTTAMHTFSGEFFERDIWYEKLGFENIEFSDDLLQNGANFCDGVFAGACDHDIPGQVSKKLKNSPSERNFIYWLTVNSHLPIAADKNLQTETCALGDENWRETYELLCRNFTVIKLTGDALTEQIMADDFPEADILIVGDHMPPYFPRYLRERFDPERVPWIFLENKEAKIRNSRTRGAPDRIASR